MFKLSNNYKRVRIKGETMNIALILSGGVGNRMKMNIPKQYVEVDGKPIILYTLKKFQNSPEIDKIVITADKLWMEKIYNWIKQERIDKFYDFAISGKSRQESVLNGLNVCMEISMDINNDNVMIHDAVRPFVSNDLIKECFRQLEKHDGCMPVLPVYDTTYLSQDGRHITKLLDRNMLFSGQAPEAFNLYKYAKINRNTPKEILCKVKGSSEIAYQNGFDIALIPGEDNNFKLTTPLDMERFRVIIQEGGFYEGV